MDAYQIPPLGQPDTRTVVWDSFNRIVMAASDIEAAMIDFQLWWETYSASVRAGCCKPVASEE